MILKNGRIALPGYDEFSTVDILVQEGKIAEIGCDIVRPDEEILDVRDLLVLPGGVDPHVHFNDPGFTDREDFYHGSAAAAAGGITTVIDMPFTSMPPVTSVHNLNRKLEAISSQAVVDFGLFGGVSAQTFDHAVNGGMEALAGKVLGFKAYMTSGMKNLGRLNVFQIREVLERTRTLELPLLLHAEDHDYIEAATRRYRKKGSGPREYYLSRPETAELLAVRAAVELAKETSGDLHIVHIGTARAAEILRENSDDPTFEITGETAPHYLAFDLTDFQRLGSVLKAAPSIKSPGNRERLWELLQEGVLDFAASDHAPAPVHEKHSGSIWTDYSGIPGCGTMFPFLYSEGLVKGRLSLRRFTSVVSRNAAVRYGIDDRKGAIKQGNDADLVLLDPNIRFRVDGKTTPFDGFIFNGKIVKTMVRGRIVYDSEMGILEDPGYGKRLERTPDER